MSSFDTLARSYVTQLECSNEVDTRETNYSTLSTHANVSTNQIS